MRYSLTYGCKADQDGSKDGAGRAGWGRYRKKAPRTNFGRAPKEISASLSVIRPTLTLIAGANGSGKSTLTRWNPDIFRQIPVLDPDAVANTLQAKEFSPPIAAARQVLASASQHLKQRESFAVKTTLAGKNYLQMRLQAYDLGLEIVLVYIGTRSVEINLERIRNCVLGGGHDVPEKDVRRRYKRSLKNLAVAIERADHVILFDNSSEDGYQLIAILSGDESQWFESKPSWLQLVTE